MDGSRPRAHARSQLTMLSAILVLAILGCALLYGVRILISNRPSYRYLLWNLVLALVPFVFAALLSLLSAKLGPGRRRALAVMPLAALWLLFYPNAPYIFTDFIHVINRTFPRSSPSDWLGINALIWYDILMNAAFAFIGHFVGLVSIWLVQENLSRAWSPIVARVLVLVAIVLSGFGIYLGRFSRLNSWDAILSPRLVFGEIGEALADPKAVLFSLAFALFVFLTYGALLAFKGLHTPGEE
jgi:uncharacterized membrane protein